MKLKCDKHGRRVLTVSNSSSFLHRTGDQSKCDSKTASLVDNTSHITRTFKVMRHLAIPNFYALGPVGTTKEPRPHGDSKQIDLTRYTRPDTRSYHEATAPIDLETGLPIEE